MPKKRRGDILYSSLQIFPVADDFLSKFSAHPLSEYLTVTHMGRYVEAENHRTVRLNRPEMATIIYCYAGSGYYRIDGGETRLIRPGQALLLPPDIPHEYGNTPGSFWSHYWIHFRGRCFDTLFDKFDKNEFPVLVSVSETVGAQMIKIFDQCFAVLEMPYQTEEFFHVCQLSAALLSLIPCAFNESARGLSYGSRETIRQTVTFMQKHIHTAVSLEDLSKFTGFSSSYVYYQFKRFSGYAPIEYFLRMKIHAASHDILFTDQSIQNIAGKYGIEDPYYFSRIFKKIMGCSPRHYRNQKGK